MNRIFLLSLQHIETTTNNFMKKLLLGLLCTITFGAYANPADDLLNRIDKGAAAKFKTILVKSDKDFFEIDQAKSGKNATAAILFASVADKYRGNNNFEYDLVDIRRTFPAGIA